MKITEVEFVPYSEETLKGATLCRLEHYLENGYETVYYGEVVKVLKASHINIYLKNVGMMDATKQISALYNVREMTEEVAETVRKEVKAGILRAEFLSEDDHTVILVR